MISVADSVVGAVARAVDTGDVLPIASWASPFIVAAAASREVRSGGNADTMVGAVARALQDGGLGAVIAGEARDAYTPSVVATAAGGAVVRAGHDRGERAIVSMETSLALATGRLTGTVS